MSDNVLWYYHLCKDVSFDNGRYDRNMTVCKKIREITKSNSKSFQIRINKLLPLPKSVEIHVENEKPQGKKSM